MKSKKGQLLWRKIVPLEIAAGVLLLSGVFLFSSSLDITRTEKRLYHTVEYIKEQCNNSELRDLASEAKSLLRVTQSVEQVQWRLQGGRDDMTSREHAEKTLEDYAEASYLDGLFLLDADGNVLAQYDKAGLTASELLAQTDTDALMDVVDFRELRRTHSLRGRLARGPRGGRPPGCEGCYRGIFLHPGGVHADL